MRITRRRIWNSLLFIAIAMAVVLNSPRVQGAGEVYSLSVSPGRIQEVNVPGVALYLNVTNAVVGNRYQFTWNVRDPNGVGRNAVNLTTATQTSFLLSVVYPRDFGGGTTVTYVGNYTVNVQQNRPVNIPSVGTGRFQVGLTDGKTYQRTFQVWTKAQGYAIGENVTINIGHSGSPALAFPAWQLADTSGSLSYIWQIPASAPTGTYTVTLAGLSTTKNPADSQTFTVYPTNVTIPQLIVTGTTIQKTLTEEFRFTPSYLSGVQVQSGQALVQVVEADGFTLHNINATYSPALGLFHATYKIPLNAEVGIWVSTINPNGLNDGYGNGGPPTILAKGFNVQPASLAVSVMVSNQTYGVGNVIPIYAIITNPDGTIFNSGTVSTLLSHSGAQISNPIVLSFVPGQGKWAGSYQVDASDPSGIWFVNVTASDPYGNSGEGSSSTVASTLSQQPSLLNSLNFILVAIGLAIAAAAVLGWALFWSRRKLAKKEVKLDLKFVDNEVERIEGKDFFQSVKQQVDEKEQSQRKGSEPSDPSKGDTPKPSDK